jgi:hypothetical protein
MQAFSDWSNYDGKKSFRTTDRGASPYPASIHILSERGYKKSTSLLGPRTYFKLKDVPKENYGYWEKLQNIDENKLNNDGQASWRDKYNRVSALISKLRLPDAYENEIVATVMSIDASPYSSYGGSLALALAVAVDVVNGVRQRYEQFEFGDRLEDDERFKELAERNGIDAIPAKKKYKRERLQEKLT